MIPGSRAGPPTPRGPTRPEKMDGQNSREENESVEVSKKHGARRKNVAAEAFASLRVVVMRLAPLLPALLLPAAAAELSVPYLGRNLPCLSSSAATVCAFMPTCTFATADLAARTCALQPLARVRCCALPR